MGITHYEDFTCWQLANELKMEMYALIARSEARHDRDFCSDARRSARSAPANIAEGFGRCTHREFAHYLSMALASLKESENHLGDARDQRWLGDDEWRRLVALAQRGQKTTSGLRNYLLRNPNHRQDPA